ncbi:MAG: uracil-DNA glycosylase [Gemmobacter sp.]|nr:uracil-DNA glycosylase [Gemmobacter sp.]
MGIGTDIAEVWTGDWDAAMAALSWQFDLGATEAISDAPVNRYEIGDTPRPVGAVSRNPVASPAPVARVPPTASDPAAVARAMAAEASDLAKLAEIQASYDLCDLRKGARRFVFADGRPSARVMILGGAPDREEDMGGAPFVGRAGQLLDRMLAAIGLSRTAPDVLQAVYLANILPWRPTGDRGPTPDELSMMMPFVERHITLASPEVLVLMGDLPCTAVLGQVGITRLRGQWSQALGLPVLPMCHPDYLLRNPHAKREAWADLLTLQARLRQP